MKFIGIGIFIWLAMIIYCSYKTKTQKEFNDAMPGSIVLSMLIAFALWCIFG